MGYDEVITRLGEFGKYQKRIYFLICLPALSCAFHKLAGVFLLASPDHRCILPFENETNVQYNLPPHVVNASYPVDDLTTKYSQCKYLDANFTDEYFENGTLPKNSVYCDRWVYDDSKYKSSATIEWDLVCSKASLRATSEALFMLGVLLGSIIFGHLSDRFGRKPIFFASLVIQLIFGVLAGIAPEYITYTISRIVIGATTSGVFLVAYVIAMEMVGPSHRLFAGVICMMFFSVGYMLTAAFAYFITDWRWLQIALTLPGAAFMSYHWLIPESARWLLSKNRKQAAIANIQKAAKVNNVQITDETIENILDDSTEKKEEVMVNKTYSILDLLKYPNLRKKSILIFFDWFVNSGTYYGLSWSANNLGGNTLLNFVISGAVEIPAYTFLLFTLNRWGRKTILCGCMLTAGTLLLLTIAVPAEHNWLIVTFAMLGKLAVTSSYGTVYIFSAEQFPTVVRNVGLGASSMFARVGGILAPYINLLGVYWKPLPLIIFGALTFFGGFLSLLLPETHNKPTLETIEDGENFGKKYKSVDTTEGGQELQPIPDDKKISNGNVAKEC